MKTALLDPIDAQHSGEMIGMVLGNSFLGFALSLLSESEAQASLAVLREIADLEAELGPEPSAAPSEGTVAQTPG